MIPGAQRAFALPLVVIIALLGGLMVAVILERSSVGHAAVQREVRAYQDHHRNVSLQLALQRWIQSSRTPMKERILPAEPELTMVFADGRRMLIDVEDAQGQVLRNFDALSTRERDIARRIVAFLEPLIPPELPDEVFFREAGPLAVSADAAEPEVLLAVASAVCVEGSPTLFAEYITSKRADDLLKDEDIRNACEESRMTADEAQMVMALVVTRTDLWRATGEVERGGGLTGYDYRAGGLFEIWASRANATGLSQIPSFYGWEDLPLDPELDPRATE